MPRQKKKKKKEKTRGPHLRKKTEGEKTALCRSTTFGVNAGFQTDRGTQTPTPLYAHTLAFPFLFQSHSQNFPPGLSQTQRQWTAATVSLWVSSWMFGGSAKLVLKTVCKCLTLRPKEISEPNQILRKICALGQKELLTIQVLEEPVPQFMLAP